jgi:CheY-like chemotaxis protein
MILKRSVEMLGHGCLAAEDGQKAWELFQKTPEVDVIISDWMMPEVDGLELCARVRESEHDGDVDGLYTFFVFSDGARRQGAPPRRACVPVPTTTSRSRSIATICR